MNELRSHLYTCSAGLSSSSESDTADTSSNTVLPRSQEPNISNTHHLLDDVQMSLSEPNASNIIMQEKIDLTGVDLKDDDNVQQLDQEQTDENTNEPLIAQDINSIVSDVLQYCDENQICSTKEVIRLLQSKAVKGRSLEIENENECLEGATNYILVDRFNILQTGMDEIAGLEDIFFTLEVQFYGEVMPKFLQFYSCWAQLIDILVTY